MRFESRHRQNVIYQLYNREDKNKEKEAGNGPSLKKSKVGVITCIIKTTTSCLSLQHHYFGLTDGDWLLQGQKLNPGPLVPEKCLVKHKPKILEEDD